MSGKTKLAIKVKGSPRGVHKALAGLVSGMPEVNNAPRLREADFRRNEKKSS